MRSSVIELDYTKTCRSTLFNCTNRQQLATDFAGSPRTVSPDEQWCKFVSVRRSQFHVPLGTQTLQLPQSLQDIGAIVPRAQGRSFLKQQLDGILCIYTQTLLHTEAFKHRRFLHTDTFTHRPFYTHIVLHADAFTHKGFYTQKLLHTDTFTYRPFYTQTLLHTEAFTHRSFYTQTILHTDTFTHRHFYTQKLLHTEAFTHRSFYIQTLFVNRLSSQSILVRVLVRVRLVLNVQLTDQQLEALFHAGSGLRLS